MDLGYRDHFGDFNFGVKVNASYNVNKLLKLADDATYLTTSSHKIGTLTRGDVGEVFPYFWGWKTDGVFQNMDEVNAFIELYVHGAPADEFAPIIDRAAFRFNTEIEWPENGKADFKMKCKQFVKIYSRVAAIMDYEVVDWEKLFWFLRLLIPQLIVTGAGMEDIKDLLDSVDLNTYGLRRTALNETIVLDPGESTIDPLKATMVNAGSTDEPNKDPLDEIIKEFNEHWFRGWEATPDDQKEKLVNITKAVANDADYQNLVIGNPDQQAVEAAMAMIIDRIIRQKRKGDMSLYREYQQNDAFKAGFRTLITRMLDNLEYL